MSTISLGARRLVRYQALTIALALVFSIIALLVGTEPADAAEPPPGFPNASNTGLSDPSALTVQDGSMVVEQDGTVIENLEIRGSLTIRANDVVVRNVWIYSGSFQTIKVESGSLLIEHSEIGNANKVGERGISGNNVTARYVNIHSVEDGIKLGSNSLFEHVYVHDLDSPNSKPHADALQAEGPATNSIIRNSTLDSTGPLNNGNAAIILKSDFGSISSILIENNYLNGGNFTIYSRNGGKGNPSGVVVQNNVLGPDYTYGRLSVDGSITFTGNTLLDGTPLDGSAKPSQGRFTDDNDSPHEADIERLVAAGVTNGCSDDEFCPESPVTRAEMAAFVARVIDLPKESGSSFSDVPESAWYAGYVEALRQAGITSGCSSDAFCPNAPVSRAEVAAFLVRASSLSEAQPSDVFADVPSSAWFAPHVEALVDADVTNGCATNPLRYCPANTATRAQLATLLVRTFDL